MNEQINVLKPYDVYGDNLQSLFRTVDWLQDHTKRHVFDTKNLKVRDCEKKSVNKILL